jgi:hypothetical protein
MEFFLHSYVFVADLLIKDRDKVIYHSNYYYYYYYYYCCFYYDSQKYNNLGFVEYFLKSYIRWPNTVRHPDIKLFPLNRYRSSGSPLRNKGGLPSGAKMTALIIHCRHFSSTKSILGIHNERN